MKNILILLCSILGLSGCGSDIASKGMDGANFRCDPFYGEMVRDSAL